MDGKITAGNYLQEKKDSLVNYSQLASQNFI
jgi:hypothetical protein